MDDDGSMVMKLRKQRSVLCIFRLLFVVDCKPTRDISAVFSNLNAIFGDFILIVL